MMTLADVTLLAGGQNWLAWIVLGGIAGTVAGRILYGRAFGFFGNIILGIIGAFVGGVLLSFVAQNTSAFFLESLLVAILGSFLVMWAWGSITGKKRISRR